MAALCDRAAAALRRMGARAVALLAALGRRSYTIMLCQIVYWAVLAPHLYVLGLHNVVVTLAGWGVS